MSKIRDATAGYNPKNILGPVGQAAGVPTGAIIESGSNGYGNYVRYADGTQICWRSTGVLPVVDPAPSFAFPATFIGSVVAFPIGPTASTPVIVASISGTAWSEIRAWSNAGVRVANGCTLYAIGRWF